MNPDRDNWTVRQAILEGNLGGRRISNARSESSNFSTQRRGDIFGSGTRGTRLSRITPTRPRGSNLYPVCVSRDNIPYSLNGCARVTPILNQRFGPNFNRRYTMPHGAPYPLRPSQEIRVVRSAVPPSQSQLPQFPFSQQQMLQEQGKPPSVPPFIWREVHHRREESITNQLAAKSMELAEFQKAFCDDTPVREVLASGWFKKQALNASDGNATSVIPSAVQANTVRHETPDHVKKEPIPMPPKPMPPVPQIIGSHVYNKPVRQPTVLRKPITSVKSLPEPIRHPPEPPHQIPFYDVLSPHLNAGCPPDSKYVAEQKLPDSNFVQPQGPSFSEMLAAAQSGIPKEQFSKEVVEQAQQMQHQAQQVVQRRQGLSGASLADNQKQRKTNFIDEILHQNRMSVQQNEHVKIPGNKPSAPNILKRNRSSELTASIPEQQSEKIVDGSSSSSSTPSVPAPAPVETRDPNINVVDSPRRRPRKQILTSDDYDFYMDSPKQIVPRPPEEIKEELIEETINTVLTDVKRAASSMFKPIKFRKADLQKDLKSLPVVKKVRGRPKKERPSGSPKPKKPRLQSKPKISPLKPDPLLSSVNAKISGRDDLEEKERIALIQALPTNLIDAIKAQKAFEEEQLKNPKKIARKSKVTKKQQLSFLSGDLGIDEEAGPGNSSLSDSLQFLQSLATMDTHTLLFGEANNATQLIDMDAENSLSQSAQVPPQFADEVLAGEQESSLPPPTATAVATSGQPLILDLQTPPMLIQAPIWTNESGPLVPVSMYQESSVQEVDIESTSDSWVNNSPSDSEQVLDELSLRGKQFEHLSSLPYPWIQDEEAVRQEPRALERAALRPKLPEWPQAEQPGESLKIAEKPPVLSKIRKMFARYGRNGKKVFLYQSKSNARHKNRMFKEDLKEQINQMWNQLIDSFVTMNLTQTQKYITLEVNGKSTQFDIDLNSQDKKNRWLPWSHNTVNQIVKQTSKNLIQKEMSQLLAVIEESKRQTPRNPMKRKLYAKMIAEAKGKCHRLTEKLNKEHIFPEISLAKTLQIKKYSLESRLSDWMERKKTFRKTTLEPLLYDWKVAASDNNTASCDWDRRNREKKMKTTWFDFRKALDYHDAIIDVTVFSSRLRFLYAHSLDALSKPDSMETHDILQSIEDTECLLILAEAKVKLLETPSPRNNDRVALINLHILADDVNIAKGKLKRAERYSEECKKSLLLRVERLSAECKRAGLSAINDKIPENWNLQIRKEDEERKTIRKRRVNIFGENGDFGLEIAVKLLSSSTLRYIAPEMWFFSPQMTSLLDEHLKRDGEREKRDSRRGLQSVVPNYRVDGFEYTKRAQVFQQLMPTVERGYWTNLKLVEFVSLKADKLLNTMRKDVERMEDARIEKDEESYCPGLEPAKNLPWSIKSALKSFRTMKLDQEKHHKDQRWIQKTQKLNHQASEENLSKEADSILDEIRKTNAIMLKTKDPVKKAECEELLKTQKAYHKRVQREKRQRKLDHLKVTHPSRNAVVEKKNWPMEDILKDVIVTLNQPAQEPMEHENQCYEEKYFVVRQRFGDEEVVQE